MTVAFSVRYAFTRFSSVPKGAYTLGGSSTGYNSTVVELKYLFYTSEVEIPQKPAYHRQLEVYLTDYIFNYPVLLRLDLRPTFAVFWVNKTFANHRWVANSRFAIYFFHPNTLKFGTGSIGFDDLS